MKAIVLNEFGGSENFRYTDVPVPQPAENEVQVQVKAISINPVDAKTRAGFGMAGRLKEQLPLVLGWDISGIVTAIGNSVTKFKVGDAVFGMLEFPSHAKAYAEYVVTNPKYLALKPDNVTFEAAATTLAALTAYQGIIHTLNVQEGERVLIHAASGGVGHYAVQIARNLGAYVIGTSSAVNKDFVLAIGANEHIDYNAQPFEEVVRDIDVVIDNLGGDYIDRSLTVLKPGGRIISYPGGGSTVAKDKAAAAGRLGYSYMVWADGKDMEVLAGLLEKGIVKAHVSKVFPFDGIAAAHAQIESGRTVGKIVVAL